MRAPALLALLLLTACAEEPDFDERYDRASEEIRAKAGAIDAQLEQPAGSDDSAASDRWGAAEPPSAPSKR